MITAFFRLRDKHQDEATARSYMAMLAQIPGCEMVALSPDAITTAHFNIRGTIPADLVRNKTCLTIRAA